MSVCLIILLMIIKRWVIEIKIWIDAGHGGKDSGALGGGLKEKDFNLIVATKVGDKLKELGHSIGLTRTTDVFLSLSDRAKLANEWKADIFVSIHCNAADNSAAKGLEVFSYPGSVKGAELSSSIYNGIVSKGAYNALRGTKTANFYVLRETDMTAALIELAFISNEDDRKLLQDRQNDFVDGIVAGVVSYTGTNLDGFMILATPMATVHQVKAWAKSKSDNPEFIGLANLYYELFPVVGVDPVLGFAQMAHETGFLYKVKSAAGLDASYHNPCGLKVTQGGGDFVASAHKRFKDWQEGVTAHRDHLALYAGVSGYPKADTPDPRHFSYLFGRCESVLDLGGNWAPNPKYGEKLVQYMREIVGTVVVDSEMEEAWAWGTLSGITDGTEPGRAATRGEVVTMIRRFMEVRK